MKDKLEKSLIEVESLNKVRENTLSLYKQFVCDQEHDIRTPLGNLASCSEFLLESLRGNKQIEEELIVLLEGISTSSKEILDYQHTLLLDLRKEQLSKKLFVNRFNLYNVSKRAFKVNLVSARYKNIKYVYNFDKSIPYYLLGDSKKIYQCLIDLLSNAVRFTSEGSVSLDIQQLSRSDREVVIRIEVSDTGIGIPTEIQDDILKAFVKAKPSNKGGDRGRGLGLTRVSDYVDCMNGELRFTSEEGKGTSFKMILPLSISLDQTKSD